MWSTVSGTHKFQQGQNFLNFWSTIFMFDRSGQSEMCLYAISQYPEGPASGRDTLLEGQPSCLFSQFFGPQSTVHRWMTDRIFRRFR
ncbi:hypothetical protein AYI69_g4684, partial [Smittium culicis]